MRQVALRLLLLSVVLSLLLTSVTGQGPAPSPAVPIEPITAIVDAFRTHRVVALAEGPHGNEQGHRFRLSLIRDPRFAEVVDDIVVEFGNARYQNIVDSFVAGGDVPYAQLRQIWENTTQLSTVFDLPIYEDFLRAVRAVNASLPRDRRIRVLLGDPPVDWERVRRDGDLSEWKKWMAQRDHHPAEVIRREVLQEGRRALVIYGDGHLWRAPLVETITSLLERTTETKVFNIAFPVPAPGSSDSAEALQPDVATWRVPAIALLRRSVLGAAAFGYYSPPPLMMVFDKVIPLTSEQRRIFERRMEDQFDALLYLGPSATITIAPLPPARCSEPEYLAMRMWRLALISGPFAQAQVDSLKAYCATHSAR